MIKMVLCLMLVSKSVAKGEMRRSVMIKRKNKTTGKIFLFNPRRTCGCIRRGERRLDRARGYSELLHKGENVSELNH